jgi:nucleoside permease NupC
MQSIQSAIGVLAMLGIAWALSENRRDVRWRLIAAGLLLAFVLAAAFLKLPPLANALSALNDALAAIERSLQAGTRWCSATSAVVRPLMRSPIRRQVSCSRFARCRSCC